MLYETGEDINNATDLQNEASLLDNDELDELLNELPVEDNYATTLNSAIVDYFNDIDQSIATEEALTDQQIVTLIQNEERDDIESDSDDSDEEPSEVSIQEAYSALKTWVTFFEQQQSSNFDMDDIKIFKKYDKITNRMLLDSQKQNRTYTICKSAYCTKALSGISAITDTSVSSDTSVRSVISDRCDSSVTYGSFVITDSNVISFTFKT
ncbi:2852_t:CDS:2, partial [Cetraspora pellucida]